MPRICYIILSCAPLLKTRVKWQRSSWLQHVPADSYRILTGAIKSTEPNVVCTSVGDNYESCPRRYYEYIRNNDLLEYDWIFFVDDDTFVFPKRLEDYLASMNPDELIYTGRALNWPIHFMSGGAGFGLSKETYRSLRAYLIDAPTVGFHKNGDTTMGMWIGHIPNVVFKNSRLLNGSIATHGDSSPISEAITYHYVTEELFKEYGKHLTVPKEDL